MSALLLLCGCDGSKAPGTFSVSFSWEHGAPSEQLLFVFARVERERERARDRSIVAEAAVVRFAPGVALRFEDVPNGAGYVVVAEIRASDQRGARALYFGESEAFALRAGEHTDVDVALELARTPGTADAAGAAVTIAEAIDGGMHLLVNRSTVTLLLRPEGATRVIAANDASFSLGRREVALAELERDAQRDATLWPDWDLDDGLECSPTGDGAGACGDGPRQVFVRFVNDQDFESQVFETKVIVLDRQPPVLAVARCTPNPANGASEVLLLIEPAEALGEPPTLTVQPEDPGFGPAELVEQTGQSYVFRYRVDAAARDDVEYSFELDMVDEAGNRADAVPVAATLRIDRSLPSTAVLAALDTAVTGGERFSFDVVLDREERLRARPVVRVGGVPVACEQVAGAVHRYHCAHTPGSDEEDGLQPISIELIDEASNVNTVVIGQIAYDRTPPALVNPVITPALAAPGTRVQVRFSLDEPAADVSLGSALAFDARLATGRDFLFEYEVGSGDADGAYPLTLNATDARGNALTNAELGMLTIDATPPTLTSATVDRAAVSAGEDFHVAFTTSEALAVPARLFVGAEEVSGCVRRTAGAAETYDCALIAPSPPAGAAHDGPQRVRVELVDLAGNVASVDADSILYGVELPSAIDATLLRLPDYAPATEVGPLVTTTHFSPVDPFTGAPVSAALSIYANKDVAVDPELTVALVGDPDERLEFRLSSRQGENVRYTYALNGSEMPGHYAFHVTFRDGAGNAGAPEQLPVVLALVSERPDNDLDLQQTVYTRAPWGTRATAGLPAFSLRGRVARDGGGTSPSRHVIVASAPQLGAGSSIGRASVGPDGGFVTDLAGGDLLDVYAAVVDHSGNASAFEPIVQGEFVATLAGKRAGSSVGNPHAIAAWDVMPVGVAPSDGSAGTELDGAGLAREDFDATDGATHAAARGAMRWTRISASAATPAAREEHAVAFDSARGRAVLFGGVRANASGLPDTWEWDGHAWHDLTPSTASPDSRREPAMAYDSVRGVVVLFGGLRAGLAQPVLNDTWEWDGETWREAIVSGPRPSARFFAAMAFDAGRGRTVLFGGSGNGSPMDDGTWEWDGRRWERVTPRTTTPPVSSGYEMVYDSARNRIVMGAGSGSLWEWDGADWREVALPAGQTRGARLFYDSAASAVSSWTPAGAFSGDRFFRWNGADWLELAGGSQTSSTSSPWVVTFDPIRKRPLRLCGEANHAFCQANEWDGSAWVDVSPTAAPSPRYSAASAYDTGRGRVVMFGGALIQDTATFIPTAYDHTWEWDGRSWQCRAGSCLLGAGISSPAARLDAAMAYDAAHGTAVLHGGLTAGGAQLDDTWEWNGQTWSCAAGACASTPQPADVPGRRSQHVLAYDAASEQIILFGGFASGTSAVNRASDTWAWDGDAKQWRRVAVIGPPGRNGHAAAFDAMHGRVAMFGGFGDLTQFDDLREYDPLLDRWVDVRPSGGTVPARHFHALAYDTDRGRLDLFGGRARVEVDELWEFDPEALRWQRILTSTPGPRPRSEHVFAYDEDDGSLFVFGGLNATTALEQYGDTWKGDFDARPAHLVQIDVAAFAPANAGASVDEIALLARAGGDGARAAEPAPGAALYVWHEHGWMRASCNRAAASAPEALGWTTRNPHAFTRMQSSGALRFALATTGAYGTDAPAFLATDYVEVRLRYHLGGGPPAAPTDPRDPGTPSGACPDQE